MTSELFMKKGQTLPHSWRYHLMAQPEAAAASFYGSTAHGLLGPSEEKTQADGCLHGLLSSWCQVPRLGPLHFREENGNHPQSLPHGVGPKERIQGWERAQVGHHWFHLHQFCEQLLWNPRNLCFLPHREKVMFPLGEQVWNQRTNLNQSVMGNKMNRGWKIILKLVGSKSQQPVKSQQQVMIIFIRPTFIWKGNVTEILNFFFLFTKMPHSEIPESLMASFPSDFFLYGHLCLLSASFLLSNSLSHSECYFILSMKS